MLRMPQFQLHRPTTVDEAVALKKTMHNSYYIAGGTDMLPNLKHKLYPAEHLISLAAIPNLTSVIQENDGSITIGALTTIADLATDATMTAHLPALAYAASVVAAPQHRTMGTIGGNIMLDTRCVYYNQTEQWRTALNYCLKCQGTYCHVLNSERTCAAAQSADTVPLLMAFDATLSFVASGGAATLPIRDLYTNDGRLHRVHTLPKGAMVTSVRIPALAPNLRATYIKIRQRSSIDYAQLAIGLTGLFENGVVSELQGVFGALMPKPKRVLFPEAEGQALTDALIEQLADISWKKCRPQTSIVGGTEWRREMVRVHTKRGLLALRDNHKILE